MESIAATKLDDQVDSKVLGPEKSEPEVIAIPDRIVVGMFLIVSLVLGGIILVDLLIGFWR